MKTFNLDDLDWSGSAGSTSEAPEPTTTAPEPTPAAEPEPTSTAGGRRELDPSLLPPAYQEGYKNRFKRSSQPAPALKQVNLDDVYGNTGGGVQAQGDDHWALTRGLIGGWQGARDSITAASDLAQIYMLPEDQQAAAMLALPYTKPDPDAVKLHQWGTDIHGAGDVLSWLGESVGQMGGSWGGAAIYGGVPGAGIGAAAGGAAGALGAGVGAAPGAAAGAVTGFSYGTMAGFGAMGVGGLFRDLLTDDGVRQALKDGTVTPYAIRQWATTGGAAIGALDAFPAAKFLKLGGKEVAKEAIETTLKQAILHGITHQAIEEGGTEALQGAISEFAQAMEGGNVDLANRALSVINQGLAGAVGGAAPGGIHGALTYTPPPPRQPGTSGPTPPAGQGAPPTTPRQPGGAGGPGTGRGAKPGQPAGAQPAGPGVNVNVTPEGGIDPDLQAAASSQQGAEGASAPDNTPPGSTPEVDLGDEEETDYSDDGEFDSADVLVTPGVRQDYTKRAAPEPAATTEEVTGGAQNVDVDAAAALQAGQEQTQAATIGEPAAAPGAATPAPGETPVAGTETQPAAVGQTPQPPAQPAASAAPEPQAQPEAGTTAQVPLMITRAMKTRLADLGYTPADIKTMLPAYAHQILQAGTPKPRPTAPVDTTAAGTEDVGLPTAEPAAAPFTEELAQQEQKRGDRTGWVNPEGNPIFHAGGRIITFMNINGTMVPFYISTGGGGKKTVATGKWYPFFGVGEDGWMNKGSEEQINSYYNVPALRQAAERLDAELGDLRGSMDAIPPGYSFAKHPDWADKWFAGKNSVDTTGLYDHLPNVENGHDHTGPTIGRFIDSLHPDVGGFQMTSEARAHIEAEGQARARARAEAAPAPAPAAPEPGAKAEQAKRVSKKEPEPVTPGSQEEVPTQRKPLPPAPPPAKAPKGQKARVTSQRNYARRYAGMEHADSADVTDVAARLKSLEKEPAVWSALWDALPESFQTAIRERVYRRGLPGAPTETVEAREPSPLPKRPEPAPRALEAILARQKRNPPPVTEGKAAQPTGAKAPLRITPHVWRNLVAAARRAAPGQRTEEPALPSFDEFLERDSWVLDQAKKVQRLKSLSAKKILQMRDEAAAGNDQSFRNDMFASYLAEQKPKPVTTGAPAEEEGHQRALTGLRERISRALKARRKIDVLNAKNRKRIGTISGLERGGKVKLAWTEKPKFAHLQPQTMDLDKLLNTHILDFEAGAGEVAFEEGFAELEGGVTGAKVETPEYERVKPQLREAKPRGKSAEEIRFEKEMAEPSLAGRGKGAASRYQAIAAKAKRRSKDETTAREVAVTKLQEPLKAKAAASLLRTSIAKLEATTAMPLGTQDEATLKALQGGMSPAEIAKAEATATEVGRWLGVPDVIPDVASIEEEADEAVYAAFDHALTLYRELTSQGMDKDQARRQVEREVLERELDPALAASAAENVRTGERTGAKNEKSAEAIKNENEAEGWPNGTRRIAYDLEERAKKKGGTDAAFIPDPLLMQMAALFHRATREYRNGARLVAKDTLREAWQLQKARIRRQEALERAASRKEADAEAKAEAFQKRMEGRLIKAVERGEMSEVEARDLLQQVQQRRRFKKRLRRERVTNPILNEILDRPPPVAPKEPPVHPKGFKLKRPRKQRGPEREEIIDPKTGKPIEPGIKSYYRAVMRPWIRQLLDDAEDALAKAGVKLGNKPSRFFYTPQENAIIFARNVNRTSRLAYEREDISRGYTLGDAYSALMWAKPLPVLKQRKNESDAEFKARKDEQAEFREILNNLLFGLITESSEQYAASYSAAQLQTQADRMEAAMEQRERTPDMEAFSSQDELRRYVDTLDALGGVPFNIKHAPPHDATLPDSVQGKRVTKRMTGKELLDKYGNVRRYQWPTNAGTFSWRQKLRTALTRALTELAGDTPVLLVSKDVLTSLKVNGSGAYISDKSGKGVIVIDDRVPTMPELMNKIAVHEMVHAATAYALRNNLRGTRDVMGTLLTGLSKQIRSPNPEWGLPRSWVHALKDEDELLTASMEDPEFQDMLASLKPTIAERAVVRALGKGRDMPSYWDIMVAAVENAIGMFAPDWVGSTYMDQIMRVFPNVAMSQEEIATHHATGEMPFSDNTVLEAPFSIDGLKREVERVRTTISQKGGWRSKGRKFINAAASTTEQIRKYAAEELFAGRFNNPVSSAINALEEHNRLVEDEMRLADQNEAALRGWINEDPAARETVAANAHEMLTDASTNRYDPRATSYKAAGIWDDADHPTKTPRKKPTWKHRANAPRRAAYDADHAHWNSLPDDLKRILSERIDISKKQMTELERRTVVKWLRALTAPGHHNRVKLPVGFDAAVQQILTGKIDDKLKKALGNNSETMTGIGRFSQRTGIYWPSYRAGEHFISGRKKITPPKPTRGKAVKDKKAEAKGLHRYVFNNLEDAEDWMATQHDSPAPRMTQKYVNPLTGEFVKSSWSAPDPKNPANELKPIPNYYVTVQDRFMAMSDDIDELNKMREEMLASGEYHNDTLKAPALLAAQHQPGGSMPLRLAKAMHNIDQLTGIDEAEKSMLKSALTTAQVQSESGNRLSKRLLRRTGVYGWQASNAQQGVDNMYRSLHTNNDMMARHIVGLERTPQIKNAFDAMQLYKDAAANTSDFEAMRQLTATDQAAIRRHEAAGGNPSLVMSEIMAELTRRLDAQMAKQGRTIIGDEARNAFLTTSMLSYLFGPSYYALQSVSLPMFTMPMMWGRMAKIHGVAGGLGKMLQYMGKASQDVSYLGNAWQGVTEALAEAGQAGRGFMSWKLHPRMKRRPKDLVQGVVDEIKRKGTAGETKYADAKVEGIRRMRLRNHVGRAGIDQLNVKTDLNAPTIKNKVFRAIEAGGEIFRALSEGLEVPNRIIPFLAYLEEELDRVGSDGKLNTKATEQAIEKAINYMVHEQVGYARENWPNWMNARGMLMSSFLAFKKFPAQMAMNFYGAVAHLGDADVAVRREAWVRFMAMSGMLALVGGFMGNPLWEPIRLLMYLLGLSTNWDATRLGIEKGLAGVVGDTTAEVLMYGTPRLAGIDVANRVSADNLLFYQQPTEMTESEWLGVIAKTAMGAPFQSVWQTGKALYSAGGDTSWPKWLAQLPIPRAVKDVLKAYDIATNGPTTTTGVHTGEPAGLLDAIIKASGFNTRTEARKFEVGSGVQHKIEQATADEKKALVQRMLNQGFTASNMRALQDWNESHTGKERIKISDVTKSRKRRRDLEKEMRKQNAEN